MPREDFRSKARRLLAEGRLTIRRVGSPTEPHGAVRFRTEVSSRDDTYASIVAEVRGDSAEIYTVTYAPRGGWACSCPARSRCSHEQAVMLVTLPATVLAAAREAS